MSQIIHNTYEIKEKIGFGGSGDVYLAWHMRLQKQVVLKADKRSLTARPEVLRREVDILKNLNHTYIPQIYDFFVEDDTVYTVMDYIEGESFDHILKQGIRFPQARVVEWACQLLEALCYLHGRTPNGILHGDIKPANIMLTPDGDIRLIDFNIALALGEDGAVPVGYSFGYASPEHYGIDSQTFIETETLLEKDNSISMTLPMEEEQTLAMMQSVDFQLQRQNRTSKGKTVLLDVRSDIYSLGATLYHIFTGRRPLNDFEQMQPIMEKTVSPEIIAIIRKAMEKNPDKRYQTAEEMLSAFSSLHRNDKRSKKLDCARNVTAAALVAIFLLGGFSTFTGLKQMENLQNAYVLAEQSQTALAKGDVTEAVSLAAKALPEKRTIFSAPYTAEAQKALTDALGVYDLSDGFKDYGIVSLPSETIKMVISPDGKYIAALSSGQLSIVDTESLKIIYSLATEKSALSDVLFCDECTILYAGESGICAFDIEKGKELWSGEAATGICLSADGLFAAAVYRDAQEAIIYDVSSGELCGRISFGGRCQSVAANDIFADPENSVLALNSDGSMLAVSFDDGALFVYDVNAPEGDGTLEIYDKSEYTHFEGGFYGNYFAFSSSNEKESIFAVVDTKEAIQMGGFSIQTPLGVQTDETGIYLSAEDVAVKIDPVTGEQTELAYIPGTIRSYARSEKYTIASGDDNTYRFFDNQANEIETYVSDTQCDFVQIAGYTAVVGSLNSPDIRMIKLKNHDDSQIFSYDYSYKHDEARLSADGSTVMLFSYDSFHLYRINGEFICQVAIPDADQVYDQQYRRKDGESYLEVIYNNGLVRKYSAENGSLMAEESGEKPDGSLCEEFMTEQLRVTSPLHGTPAAYDIKTGKKICSLESEDYLTYVSQIGEYIITEYINADGERYGILMNTKCENLAYLPDLCDITEKGELIFDYRSGNLRKSRIYSIKELISMGQAASVE